MEPLILVGVVGHGYITLYCIASDWFFHPIIHDFLKLACISKFSLRETSIPDANPHLRLAAHHLRLGSRPSRLLLFGHGVGEDAHEFGVVAQNIEAALAVPETESRAAVRRVTSAMRLRLDAAAERLKTALTECGGE